MRKILFSAVLVGLSLVTLEEQPLHAAPVASQDAGTVVIVFKDGHRQSFPVSAISTMEVKSASGVSTPVALPVTPNRNMRRFVGKWSVGEGDGGSFYMTLDENGTATKSIGEPHGTWTYVDGEAHVAWDDGWHDAIRKVGSKYQKFAYSPGKTFTDKPANVTEARNTNPQPI
jgi:hypothetical protein